MQQVPVVFRKFNDGEVIALFPTIPAGEAMRDTACEAYTMDGVQYVDISIVNTTKEAEPSDYVKLLTKVVNAGYEVDKIAKRITGVLNSERLAAIHKREKRQAMAA